jgi:LPS export ABC transporter protein LptC
MKKTVMGICILMILFAAGCTFDYGDLEAAERTLPDLIMENVEYVRVRSADPIARIQAERLERYENQGIMKLQNFVFEQFGGERGEEVNAAGSAGLATVRIDSGDIYMDNGVRMEVESEDIIIETTQLNWKDAQRQLSSGGEDTVHISQQNGTNFMGIGLFVDIRNRTWEFFGTVSGTFIHEDDEDENEDDNDDL